MKVTLMYCANIRVGSQSLHPFSTQWSKQESVERAVFDTIKKIADAFNTGKTIQDLSWIYWGLGELENNVWCVYSQDPETMVAAAKEAFEAIAEAIGVFDNSP